jgi:hypothetical protein
MERATRQRARTAAFVAIARKKARIAYSETQQMLSSLMKFATFMRVVQSRQTNPNTRT